MSMQGRIPTIKVDHSRCVRCKNCVRICIEGVWKFNEEKGYSEAKYPEDCLSCYQCEMVCPNHCIEVIPAEKQYYDMLEKYES